MSGSRKYSSVQEQVTEGRTVVKETVEDLWLSKVRMVDGSWLVSSVGASAVETGTDPEYTHVSQSSGPGYGM